MIILFYGEYIVHLHCQRTGRVIHTKIVYICFTQAYVYGIAYFPFHSVFHSVPRFNNTRVKRYWMVKIFSNTNILTLTFDLNNRVHLFSRSIQCIMFGNFPGKGQETPFFSKISSLTLTCDLNINNRNLLSIDTHCTKFIHIPAKGSRDNEKKTFFQRPAVWPWPLNIWPGNPYVSSILCRHDPLYYLAAINQIGQEILSFLHKNQQSSFDFDLWPRDLKINMGHLLPMGIHCTKFGNFQAQGSKDLGGHLTWFTDRPTDRCKT